VVAGVRVDGCAHAIGQRRVNEFGVGVGIETGRELYSTCGGERFPAEAQRRWEDGTWFPLILLL
jgi:hypothetical protein